MERYLTRIGKILEVLRTDNESCGCVRQAGGRICVVVYRETHCATPCPWLFPLCLMPSFIQLHWTCIARSVTFDEICWLCCVFHLLYIYRRERFSLLCWKSFEKCLTIYVRLHIMIQIIEIYFLFLWKAFFLQLLSLMSLWTITCSQLCNSDGAICYILRVRCYNASKSVFF
jgi:hypothetical protein